MSTSTFEKTYASAFMKAERLAIVRALRARPETTLGELSDDPDLRERVREIKIGELLSGAGKVARLPGSFATVGPRRRGSSSSRVETRTREGRARYDAAVLAAIAAASGEVGAGEIRKQVGGTRDQVRIALKRLAKARQVARTGQRSKTRYALRPRT